MGVQVNSYFKSKYTGAQIENMLDAFGNTAAAYETSTAYSVGDLVLYNNALYVCTGATTGAFDPTKWQQTTLAELVENLGATYTDPNSDGNVVIGVDSTTGDEILRSITFPTLTKKYYLPFAQYIRERLQNDPSAASFSIEIPDAEEAPMHSTKIKGKTEATDQLANPQDGSGNGITFTVSNGIITFSGTASGATCPLLTIPMTGRAGHVCYVNVVSSGSSLPTVSLRLYKTDSTYSGVSNGIFTVPADPNYFQLALRSMVSATSYSGSVIVQVIDLTVCGYTAAETTDTDTFKAAFLKRRGFTLPTVLPYDEGSLANVNGTYRMRGRNLWANGDVSKGATTYQSITLTNPLKAGTYTVSLKATSATGQVRLSFRASSAVNVDLVADGSRKSATFTLSYDCSTVYFYGQWSASSQNVASLYDVQIEEGTTAHDFEAFYNGGEIDCSTAPLNGVGTAQDEEDFATGVRTTRCGMVDLGTLNWAASSGNVFYVTGASSWIKFPPSINTAFNGACGKYQTMPYGDGIRTDKSIYTAWVGAGTNYLYVHDSAYNDATALKTALSGTMLCYELATPVVTTETPQPLATQYGYNVLEPVSGGVQSAEVDTVYYENIAGYIDKRLNGG